MGKHYVGKHRLIWEIFDPMDGVPVMRVESEYVARNIAHRLGLDYAEQGKGWN
jgi:hypothetical protein